MIGNDVIDLIQSRRESNWQRKGYLEKIFTVEEQILIAEHSNPEIMVWMLWSMKEAAYKIYNRKTKVREYIPKKLSCSLLTQKTEFVLGQVSCGEYLYYTKTYIFEQNLHTVAVSRSQDLENIIEINKKTIVKDQYGIPYLHGKQSNILQDVSVSHHGRFEKIVCIG